jgi:hypothetical protein
MRARHGACGRYREFRKTCQCKRRLCCNGSEHSAAITSGTERRLLDLGCGSLHAMLGTPITQTLNDGILHGYAAAVSRRSCRKSSCIVITSSRFDSIDWELLLKAVRKHPPRMAGTPQGGVISPILSNLGVFRPSHAANDVHEIDAARFDPNAHFARLGLGIGRLPGGENVGRPSIS